MPTIAELSQKYADKIIAARDEDRLVKKADIITEASRKRTHLATALMEIARDLDNYTIDGAPLTQQVRTQILEGTGLIIGWARPVNFSHIVKAASNDDFTSMGDNWDEFFKPKR